MGGCTHQGQVHDGFNDLDRRSGDLRSCPALLLPEHAQRPREDGRTRTRPSRVSSCSMTAATPMSPSHAAKGGQRWRYYVSQAILQGRNHEAGSVARAPALEIEARVAEAARAASPASNRQGRHELHQPRGERPRRVSRFSSSALERLAQQPCAPPSSASSCRPRLPPADRDRACRVDDE